MNAVDSPIDRSLLATPVVFIVFNRPDCTAKALERIRAARPRRLYVIADGPRANRPGEAELVHQTRAVVDREIDWPCDVRRDYAAKNLGCARRVSSGLDWVFATEEQAIILEDDCVAEPTFFPYCEQLLDFYRTNEQIFVISGTNQQYRPFHCSHSYFFSRYNHCWGWATWARAWRHFDFAMTGWPEYRVSPEFEAWFGGAKLAAHWRRILDEVAAGKVDSWGYRWVYACWRQRALSVLPCRPLIKNIGFDARATHTRKASAAQRALVTEPMRFPLAHPDQIVRDAEADTHTESQMYRAPSWARRVLTAVKRIGRRFQ
jgi:hypothetical protein